MAELALMARHGTESTRGSKPQNGLISLEVLSDRSLDKRIGLHVYGGGRFVEY